MFFRKLSENEPVSLSKHWYHLQVYRIFYWANGSRLKSYILLGSQILLITTLCSVGNYIYYQCSQPQTRWPIVIYAISVVLSYMVGTVTVHEVQKCSEELTFFVTAVDTSPYLNVDHPESRRQIYLHNLLFIILYGLNFVGLNVIFILMEFLTCDESSDRYTCGFMFPVNVNQIRPLPRPIRDILSFLICQEISYMLVPVVSGTVFSSAHVFYIKVINTNLIRKLYTLRKTPRGLSRRAIFSDCVKHHQFIICLIEKTTWMYKRVLLMQLCSTSMIMCAIIVTIMKANFQENRTVVLLSLGHIIFYIIATIIFGLIGEELEKISFDLERAVFYAIPWDGDIQLAKDMAFMMRRSSIAFTLPAGNFTSYSNELVMQVFKMCYSMVTVFGNF